MPTNKEKKSFEYNYGPSSVSRRQEQVRKEGKCKHLDHHQKIDNFDRLVCNKCGAVLYDPRAGY